MSTFKSITIYESQPDSSPASHEEKATTRRRQHKEEPYISSSLPSIQIKNIIYNALPVEDPNSTGYKLHVQLPIAIKTYVIGKGFTMRASGDMISLVGLYVDTSQSFIQASGVRWNHENTSLRDKARLGVLTLKSLDMRYDYPSVPRVGMYFTHQLLRESPEISKGSLGPLRLAMRFADDNDAMAKIHRVEDLLLSRAQMYCHTLPRTMDILHELSSMADEVHPPTTRPSPMQPNTNAAHQIIGEIVGQPIFFKHSPEAAESYIFSSTIKYFYMRMLLNETINLEAEKSAYAQRLAAKQSAEHLKMRHIAQASSSAWCESIARREFQKPMGELSQSEKDVVQSAYDRERKHIMAHLANKCQHTKLVRRVMSSRSSVFDVRAWAALEKFAPLTPAPGTKIAELPKYDEMLACQRCGMTAMCPHLYFIFSLKDTLWGGDEQACMKYVVDNFTTLQSEITDASYCRICGELLQKTTAESESWVKFSRQGEATIDDDLFTTIINEVQQTVNANIDMSRSNLSKAELVTNIARCIDPWIRHYELKLSRIKTNTEIIISFSLYLIIGIYTLMSIVHLIMITRGEISIKTLTIPSGTEGMKLLTLLFNKVYKLITAQRTSIIEKVPAFTPDRIKKIMTRAYKQVSNTSVVIETTVTKYKIDLIADNPLYMFLEYGWRVGDLMRRGDTPMIVTRKAKGKSKKSDLSDARDDADDAYPLVKPPPVETVLGVPPDQIDTLKYFFSEAKMPPEWPSDDPYHKYVWRTYARLAKRLIDGEFDLNAENTPGLMKEYLSSRAERASVLAKANARLNIVHTTVFTKTYVPEAVDAHLAQLYCPTGTTHRWDIYVFGEHEYKASDLKATTPADKLITKKCSLCSARLDELDGDTKALEAIIADLNTKTAFAMYYKIRCPAGFIHHWDGDKCNQCGLPRGAKEIPQDYFAKYKDTFVARNDALHASNEHHEDSGMIVPSVTKKAYKPWVVKNDSITATANALSIPYNLLINIGLTKDMNYDTLVSGKVNPSNSASDEMWFRHADAVSAYISNIVILWNKFVACNVAGLPSELEEMCVAHSDDIRALGAIDLADFYDERAYRQAEQPRVFANWMTNKLCSILLGIHDNKASPKIAKKFTEVAARVIMDSEKNMSKPLLYKNVVASAKEKMTQAHELMGIDHDDMPESDEAAKDFITNTLDHGESFSRADLDVDNIADSFGADVI
jgi:hypothetical protein